MICKPVTGKTRKIKAYETDKHSTTSWNINEPLALHCVQPSSTAPLHYSMHRLFSVLFALDSCEPKILQITLIFLSTIYTYLLLVITLSFKGNLEYHCCTLLMYTEVFLLSLITETNSILQRK